MKYKTKNQEYTIYVYKLLTLLFIAVFAAKVASISILNQEKDIYLINTSSLIKGEKVLQSKSTISFSGEDEKYEPLSFRVVNSLMDYFFNYSIDYCSCIFLHLLSSGAFMVLFDMLHTYLHKRRMTKFTKVGML